MYSGTTLRTKSGRVMGVHQRIDRLARRGLDDLTLKHSAFPGIRAILHFEGLNGPDGIKRKSPGQDEPWHYIDPSDPNDNALREMIEDHIVNLSEALAINNQTRAAFEAAWLAHAITDGLTPAHHYPLEEKLEELRGNESLETRDSVLKKIFVPGKNKMALLRNNWEYWGAKGVMTTHFGFELGVATTISAARVKEIVPSISNITRVKEHGFIHVFDDALKHVAKLDLYDEYIKAGWTRRLARDTREKLVPEIVQTVSLAWYDAVLRAEEIKGNER